jgi:diguanylate cyclase (GGDEF)-like protein
VAKEEPMPRVQTRDDDVSVLDAPDDLEATLAVELAAATSGIGFIYRCLGLIVERLEVRDALVVLDEPGVGHQVFQAGRRAPDGWSTPLALSAPPGVYTDPSVDEKAPALTTALALCQVAVRLDLARYDSLHDLLTGLYNRRCFEDLLAQAVGQARRYGWSFSLVLLDLDGFKRINDRHGHAAGDALLSRIGEELRLVLRRGDIAARFGGDELALILAATTADEVPLLIERLREGLSTGLASEVSFSIGVAACPEEADDPVHLKRLADERLYAHKRR